MEEKKITPEEGMQVITQMIEASKQRMSMPNLRISIMWATLAIVTGFIVIALNKVENIPWVSLAWFAIPGVGLPMHINLANKFDNGKVVKTTIDNINEGIWKALGYIAIGVTVICCLMQLDGYSKNWMLMVFYDLVVVGFATAIQGIVIKQKYYIAGGGFSVIWGFAIMVLVICDIPVSIDYIMVFYIQAFLVMFIVPAAIIRNKLNSRQKCKN